MKNIFLSNPAPGENLVSGNLVMETGCTRRRRSWTRATSVSPWAGSERHSQINHVIIIIIISSSSSSSIDNDTNSEITNTYL